jgi:hypothetical protein
VKTDESHRLSATLKESGPIIELASLVEEKQRVRTKRPDPNHILAVDPVPSELP